MHQVSHSNAKLLKGNSPKRGGLSPSGKDSSVNFTYVSTYLPADGTPYVGTVPRKTTKYRPQWELTTLPTWTNWAVWLLQEFCMRRRGLKIMTRLIIKSSCKHPGDCEPVSFCVTMNPWYWKVCTIVSHVSHQWCIPQAWPTPATDTTRIAWFPFLLHVWIVWFLLLNRAGKSKNAHQDNGQKWRALITTVYGRIGTHQSKPRKVKCSRKFKRLMAPSF